MDLVWASSPLAPGRVVTASIADDITIPSDHSVLRIAMPGGVGACYGQPGKYKTETLDEEGFTRAIMATLPGLPRALNRCHSQAANPSQGNENLDIFAHSLSESIQGALTTSCRPSSGKATGYSWFHAARGHHAAAVQAGLPGHRERTAAEEAQNQLRRCVTKVKQQFFREKVESVSQDKDLYKTTQWAKLSRAVSIPSSHGSCWPYCLFDQRKDAPPSPHPPPR